MAADSAQKSEQNRYLDLEQTKAVVGSPDFMRAGYAAQLKSIVLLTNQDKVLPLRSNQTPYLPKRHAPAGRDFFGGERPASLDYLINVNVVKKLLGVTDNPAGADFALVVIDSPHTGTGYDPEDVKKGGTGNVPISLQ
jgi:beta-glucosidase